MTDGQRLALSTEGYYGTISRTFTAETKRQPSVLISPLPPALPTQQGQTLLSWTVLLHDYYRPPLPLA